jgi:SEC-C motif
MVLPRGRAARAGPRPPAPSQPPSTTDLPSLPGPLPLAPLRTPLPPLRCLLHPAGWETFGGHVGPTGTSWNLTRIKNLSRPDAITATEALGILLTWDAAPAAGAAQSDDRKALEVVTGALAVPAIVGYLADQPELQPALMDAGEYAACRGDLRVADDYLRRVRNPIAATLRSALRVVLNAPVKGTQPGRHRPCPCGSGRKFTVCCYPPVVAPLARRAELLYNLVATFAQRAPSGDPFGHLVNAVGPHPQHALLCVDLLLTHQGFTERFLRTRGAWLRDDERTLIETWTTTPLGAFEIRSVRRGMGVTLRMLPGGPPVPAEQRRPRLPGRRTHPGPARRREPLAATVRRADAHLRRHPGTCGGARRQGRQPGTGHPRGTAVDPDRQRP